MNERGPDDEKAVAARLALLRQKHGDIDASVAAVLAQPMPDQLMVARLKKKKLWLSDQIVCLESSMMPDIIA